MDNAESMLKMQSLAKQYQGKLDDLINKEYQGKYQGISIKMKGDYTVIEVSINQSFYETAGKSQMENAIQKLLNNLQRAIFQEQEELKNEMQETIRRMQQEELTSNGTDQSN